MPPLTIQERAIMLYRAVELLCPQGWANVGWMRFRKGGRTYDLSAADLSQIERIEREGLFVVSDEAGR